MPKEKKQRSEKKKSETGLFDELVVKPLKALDDLITGKVFDGPKKKKGDDDGETDDSEEVSDESSDDEEDEDDEDDEREKRKSAHQRGTAVDVTINHVFSGKQPGGGKRKRTTVDEPDAADPAEEDGEAEGK